MTKDTDMQPYLSLHSLTTYTNVLLVRDENGLPKETPYGGVTRTRISSQSDRRAQRTHLRDRANLGEGPLSDYTFGTRTREWALTAAKELEALGWNHDDAVDAARHALIGLKVKFGDKDNTRNLTKVLLFAHDNAGRDIATALHTRRDTVMPWLAQARAAEASTAKAKPKGRGKTTEPAETPDTEPTEEIKAPPLDADIKKELLAALAPADAIDIALFGRFLAEIVESPNVDGAIQSAHTFTVHEAQVVDDFYSSADDAKLRRKATALDALEDGGAGMTGYQSLTTGTFYRHACLDRRQLRRNLHAAGLTPDKVEAAAVAAEKAFLDAFCNAVPAAKKNSTAGPGTLPKFVLATEGTRPFNYAGCFETPIHENAGPASIQGTRLLLRHHALLARKRDDIGPARVLTYDVHVQELLDDLRDTTAATVTEVDRPEDLAS
ncbi:type I-E CRISPR-associated protein Cas7/Cse4/CasC [Embleya sp. NPDC050493]|uniref:type I-E CRISPR-associated protein Cas7/Cse4/CasC n=1 Tax=Embleya sp. NPDC050493 TaxID=3363989 RepID=UPI0037B34C04